MMIIQWCLIIAWLSPIFSKEDSKNNTYSLNWSNMEVFYGKKKVISVVAGSVQAGRLLGILGPSGSGKSTFLRSISHRITPKTGYIYYTDANGKMTYNQKSDIAFVHQDDSFFPTLTLRETLRLSGKLRIISDSKSEARLSKSVVQLNDRILQVVNSLGLSKVIDSTVGQQRGSLSASSFSGGISGGERKRLSVACELLGNPKLLIADEPTSGLDSFQALQVVQSLKNLTRSENIITICSIHQPRSSIWNLFDDVLLMTPTGRIAYHGSANNVLSYFKSIGYPCPANTNAAEHLIDLVSLDVSGEDALQRSRLRIDQIADAFEAFHRNGTIVSQYDKLVANHGTSEGSTIIKPGGNVFFRAFSAIGRSVTRFLLLLGRSVKQTTRDVTTNVARLGTAAVLALVIGSVYGTQSSTIKPDSVANRVNVIALGSVNMAMLSVIKTLQLFKLEQGIINRERSGEQYTALEYLLSKSLAELPFDGLVGAFFGFILHWKTNMRCDRIEFMKLLALLGCASSSLGLAISALAPSGDIALAVGPALMVVYLIMGSIGPAGIKGDKLPTILLPFRYASPMKWACEGLLAAEFKDQAFDVSEYIPEVTRLFIIKHFLKSFMDKVKCRFQGKPKNIVDVTVEPKLKDGDQVLSNLGVPNATYLGASNKLGIMLATHLCLAFLGLVFGKRPE